jgi:thioesterase domain-containing protein
MQPASSASELERYLHANIPLSAAMQVQVRTAGADHVQLFAPLGPNINHRDTAFGGSISALATLAAWSLLRLRLQSGGHDARLVIQRNAVNYEEAIRGDFVALARLTDETRWERFVSMLERRGRARISLGAQVMSGGRIAATFEGEFVALRS